MNNSKIIRLLALVPALVMVLGLVACGNTPAEPTQPTETQGQDEVQAKDTIVYAQFSDCGNVANYLYSDDRISMSMLAYINDGLFTMMPDGSNRYKIDALFEDGKATTDTAERQKIYTELQQKVADEALFSPFGTNLRLLVVTTTTERGLLAVPSDRKGGFFFIRLLP